MKKVQLSRQYIIVSFIKKEWGRSLELQTFYVLRKTKTFSDFF